MRIRRNLGQQVTPTGQGTGAMVTPSAAYNPAADIGRAISRTGDLFARMQERSRAVDRINQIASAEAADVSGWGTFKLNLDKDPDYSTYIPRYQQFWKDHEQTVLSTVTDPIVQQQAGAWLKKQKAVRDVEIQEMAWNRQADATIGMAGENLRRLAEAGRDEDARDYLDGLYEHGILSGARRGQFMEYYERVAAKYAEEQAKSAHAARMDGILSTAIGMDDPAMGLDYIMDQEELTAEDKKNLTSDLDGIWDRRQEAEAENRARVQDDTERQAFGMFSDGTLTHQWIRAEFEAGRMSAVDRDKYTKRLNERKPIETDRAVKWDIKQSIHALKMGQTTAEAVKKQIDKHWMQLSDTDLSRIQDDFYAAMEKPGTADPVAASLEDWGKKRLKQAYDTGIFSVSDERAEIIENEPQAQVLYDRRQAQWEQFWKNNPQATQTHATEFMDLLVSQDVKGAVGDFFRRGNTESRLAELERNINTELARSQFDTSVGSFFLQEDSFLSNDPNDIGFIPESFSIGQKKIIDGTEYTYQGNGNWEY
jgi:hypothetical protein